MHIQMCASLRTMKPIDNCLISLCWCRHALTFFRLHFNMNFIHFYWIFVASVRSLGALVEHETPLSCRPLPFNVFNQTNIQCKRECMLYHWINKLLFIGEWKKKLFFSLIFVYSSMEHVSQYQFSFPFSFRIDFLLLIFVIIKWLLLISLNFMFFD